MLPCCNCKNSLRKRKMRPSGGPPPCPQPPATQMAAPFWIPCGVRGRGAVFACHWTFSKTHQFESAAKQMYTIRPPKPISSRFRNHGYCSTFGGLCIRKCRGHCQPRVRANGGRPRPRPRVPVFGVLQHRRLLHVLVHMDVAHARRRAAEVLFDVYAGLGDDPLQLLCNQGP